MIKSIVPGFLFFFGAVEFYGPDRTEQKTSHRHYTITLTATILHDEKNPCNMEHRHTTGGNNPKKKKKHPRLSQCHPA